MLRSVLVVILLSGCLVPIDATGEFEAAPLMVGASAEDHEGAWRIGTPVERLTIDGMAHACLPLALDGDEVACLHPETFEPVWKPDSSGSHDHWAELDSDGAFQYIAFQLAGGTYNKGDSGSLSWYGAPARYTVLRASAASADFTITLELHGSTVDNTYNLTLARGSPWPTSLRLETFRILHKESGWHDGTSGDVPLPPSDGPDWQAMIDALLPATGTYPAGGDCPAEHPSWHDVLDLWETEQADTWAAAAAARPLRASIEFPDTRPEPRLGSTYRFSLTVADGKDSWSFSATREEGALGVEWETSASASTLDEAVTLPPTVVGFCDLWQRVEDRAGDLDRLDVRHFPSPFPEVAILEGTSWGWTSMRLVMDGGAVAYSAHLGTLRSG